MIMTYNIAIIRKWIILASLCLLINANSIIEQKSPLTAFSFPYHVGNTALETGAAFTLVLPCPHFLDEKSYWTRNGVKIETDDRIKLKGILLFIKPFLSQDTGIYRCYVSNKYGTSVSRFSKVEEAKIPRLSNDASSYRLQPGISANLDCRLPQIMSPRPVSVYWKRRSTGKPVVEDERITVSLNNGNLYFATTQEADKDAYQCHVNFTTYNNPNRIVSIHGGWQTLIVQGKPIHQGHPSVEIIASTTQVMAGKSVILECIAGGHPIPDIAWYKNGNNLDLSDDKAYQVSSNLHRLRISTTSSSDSGVYICIASSRNQIQNASFTLHVYDLPEWIQSPQEINILEQERFDWKCRASGKDTTYEWYINSALIHNSTKYTVWLNGTLTLHNPNPNDSMVYTCNAINPIGNIVKSAYLTVNVEAPLIQNFPKEDIHAQVGDNITIYCNATGGPTPTIAFNKNGKLIEPNKFRRIQIVTGLGLIIQNATLADASHYGCIANNRLGRTEKRVNLVVYRKTSMIVKPIDAITHKNANVTLTCTVHKDSKSQVEVTWIPAIEDQSTAYSIVNNTQSKEVYVSVMTIYSVRVTDSGTYTCVSKTSIQTLPSYEEMARTDIIVKEQDVPNPPYNLHCYNLNTTAVRLEWTAGDSNLAPITQFWLKVKMTTISEQLQYIMEGNVSAITNSVDVPVVPYNTYLLTITAINFYGVGTPNSKECNSTLYDIPHQVPAYLRASASAYTADIIYTTWIPIPRIHYNGPGFGYKIVVKKVSSNQVQRLQDLTIAVRQGTATSEVIDGLEPNALYLVKVISFNDMGDSDADGEILYVKTGESPPNLIPSHLSIYPVTPMRAWLIWYTGTTSQRINIRGFKVAYWIDGDLHTTDTVSVGNNVTETIIEDLTPKNNYTFQITTFGNGGTSTLSLTERSNLAKLVPGPVRSFEIVRKRFGTIEVLWSPPLYTNGLIRNYRIQCIDTVYANSPRNIAITEKNSTYLSLPFELDYGYYKFTIEARNDVNYGVPVTTDKRIIANGPKPPTNLTEIGITNTSVTVGWQVDDIRYIDGFILEFKRMEDKNYLYTRSIDASERQITIDDLIAGTTYQFILRSRHGQYTGHLPSNILIIQTKASGTDVQPITGSTTQIAVFATIGVVCALLVPLAVYLVKRKRRGNAKDTPNSYRYVVTVKRKPRKMSADTIHTFSDTRKSEDCVCSRLDSVGRSQTLQMPVFYPDSHKTDDSLNDDD